LDHVSHCFHRIKQGSILDWFRDTEKAWGTDVSYNETMLERLEKSVEEYKSTRRLEVIRPFAHLFDPSVPRLDSRDQRPTHRGLYWGFYYQWSLMNFADGLVSLMRDFVALEKKRKNVRLWFPVLPSFASWRTYFHHDEVDEEDPEFIPGLESGLSAPRDPDHLPP
jgi:hypothetical protein